MKANINGLDSEHIRRGIKCQMHWAWDTSTLDAWSDFRGTGLGAYSTRDQTPEALAAHSITNLTSACIRSFIVVPANIGCMRLAIRHVPFQTLESPNMWVILADCACTTQWVRHAGLQSVQYYMSKVRTWWNKAYTHSAQQGIYIYTYDAARRIFSYYMSKLCILHM